MAPQVKRCRPTTDEFSSCYNLFYSNRLRMCVMILGLMALLGNLVVLQQRLKQAQESAPSTLVQHLALSDMMMGIYLVAIMVADFYFR